MSGTTTTILSQMRQQIASHIAGADMNLIDDAIRWTMYEFCKESRIYKESFNVNLLAATTNYVVTPALAGGQLTLLVSAFIGTAWRVYPQNLEAVVPGATGRPQYMQLGDARTIQVYPTPTTAETMVVLAAVTPSVNSGSALFIPYVCEPYFQMLVEAAVGFLQRMPDKPWSSLVRGEAARVRFNSHTARVRNDLSVGRGYGGRTRVFNRFGR